MRILFRRPCLHLHSFNKYMWILFLLYHKVLNEPAGGLMGPQHNPINKCGEQTVTHYPLRDLEKIILAC